MALPKTGKYLLYDATGNGDGLGGGADIMAQAMINAGFTNVYVLQGGFASWQAVGYPTESMSGGFLKL